MENPQTTNTMSKIPIQQKHKEAMSFAKQADELNRKAFNIEKEVALELKDDTDAEPTRSVLFRSAATLAYNIGELEESHTLILAALEGSPHDEIKKELNQLLIKIENTNLQEQYAIMEGRLSRALSGLEESEKQFGELQESYNKLLNE